ncbi:hypothetical protein CDAR_250521 [Caerostris darwini]|uniref:Uncharacterized protein n=1 Tax=Caerostris darwini TaxID=1538125 RepID=A0AAV4UE71_9ARAC|nr:hypothetical protein CDAR_250521 [Caerostris darwini]
MAAYQAEKFAAAALMRASEDEHTPPTQHGISTPPEIKNEFLSGDVFPAEVRYVSAMTARIRFVQQLLILGPLEGQLFLEWDIVSESTDLKENGTNVGGKGITISINKNKDCLQDLSCL